MSLLPGDHSSGNKALCTLQPCRGRLWWMGMGTRMGLVVMVLVVALVMSRPVPLLVVSLLGPPLMALGVLVLLKASLMTSAVAPPVSFVVVPVGEC